MKNGEQNEGEDDVGGIDKINRSLLHLALCKKICGIPVIFGIDFVDGQKQYELSTFSDDDSTDAKLATVRPSLTSFHDNSVENEFEGIPACIARLYLDNESRYTYVNIDIGGTYLTTCKYNLSNVLPGDSIVFGFVYFDVEGEVVIALFDCYRLGGVETKELSGETRFRLMLDKMKHGVRQICHHWIGEKKHAVMQLQEPDKYKMPFRPHSVMQIKSV